MKKTVQTIRQSDVFAFTSQLQKALDEGYELQSSTAFSNEGLIIHFAVLIKEEK